MGKAAVGANGVIRIGKKGRRKFAIGDEDDPRALPVFEVDVVVAFQQWISIDESYRTVQGDEGRHRVPNEDMPAYHVAAVVFTREQGGDRYGEADITVSEALDFIARLREQYKEMVDFFQPRPRAEPGSPASSGVELRFSEEEEK